FRLVLATVPPTSWLKLEDLLILILLILSSLCFIHVMSSVRSGFSSFCHPLRELSIPCHVFVYFFNTTTSTSVTTFSAVICLPVSRWTVLRPTWLIAIVITFTVFCFSCSL